ncbi:MAG: hypothetical protein PHI60_08895, partial [Candidatus Omnitrophica bacterium]|nr:hypothetical protein [Candidatus Omnitrophota bacterium]
MGKRYPGIRTLVRGEKYEIFWQVDGYKSQHRVMAASEKEASLIRAEEMAEHRKQLSVPKSERERLTSSFADIWENLKRDILG